MSSATRVLFKMKNANNLDPTREVIGGSKLEGILLNSSYTEQNKSAFLLNGEIAQNLHI